MTIRTLLCTLRFAGFISLALCAPAKAERLTLKDGTVLEGTVIQRGNDYWFKPADGGQARTFPAAEVESVGSGEVSVSTTREGKSSPASANFESTRRRAEACDTPMAAVVAWQHFLDAAPATKVKPATVCILATR